MADKSIIGRNSRVRGRITGASDLEIQGRLDGSAEVSGELIVDVHALVAADLGARRLVVRGAVKGNLTAEEAVALDEGARVVGDIRAPRVSIAQGALVRGYVQTANVSAPAARARAVAASAPRSVPKPAITSVRSIPAQAAERPHATIERRPQASSKGAASKGSSQPSKRAAPPPPVVPVLKKGAKGTLQKKRAG